VSLLVPDADGDGPRSRRRKDYRALRLRVGYMAGRFSLYPDSASRRTYIFRVGLRHDRAARVRADRADLRTARAFKDRRAAALSGGMKQKLALCCALVHRPTSCFSTNHHRRGCRVAPRVLGPARRPEAGGLTTVVSTPYMDEATRCDRIALIHRGTLVGVDTPAGITAPSDGRSSASARRIGTRRCSRCGRTSTPGIYPFGDVMHYTDARLDAPVTRHHERREAFLDAKGFAMHRSRA